MTLTQLSYIVAVDRYRHFATAAEKTFVTQPTLSMQIHKLEEELGVTIFDRSKSPVVPTEIGERIIEQAKEMLKQSKRIEDLALINDEELKGEFRIGIIPTVAPYLLPLFLKSFAEKYPKVKLVFEEMMTNELLDLLEQDQIDVGIIATPTEQSFIHEVELYYEPFVGYVSGTHPLSKREKLNIEDLDASNLWLLNEGHCFRDQTIKLCKKHRREASKDLNIEFESGNLETLKQLVEQDFGMTLLPYLAINQINQHCAKAYLRYFEDPAPRRKVRLAYSREFLKNNIIQAFTDEVRSCVPDELKKSEEGVVVE